MEHISKNNSLETAKNRLDISGLTYVRGTKYVYDRIVNKGLNDKLIKYMPLIETSSGYVLRYKNLMRQYYWLINDFIPSCSYEKLCMRNGEKKWIRYDNPCDASRTYLTFSFYDGDSLIATISVVSGNTATPFIPSKTGYSFSGWTTENGGNVFFDFSTPITENTSVYAKYEIKELQIRFRLNNGEPDIVITVNYGDTPSISDPQKEGYTFNGWSPEIVPATKNAIYQATYIQDIYIIRFFDIIDSEHVLNDYNNQPIGGGSTTEYTLVKTETHALHDRSIYYLTRPTYQHFECIEEGGNTWWIDRNGNPISASTFLDVTQDLLEVFPKLTKKNYTVSFIDWDNTVLSTQTVVYLNDAVAPSSPSRSHYTFIGWDRSYTGITDDTVIHALYIGESINVTYMVPDTGGTFVVFSSVTTTYNSTAPIVEAPTEENYPPEDYGVFDGWYTDGSYLTPFDYTVLLSSDTVIYGKWRTEFEVTFYNWDGTLITGDTQTGFANPVYVSYGGDVSDTELDFIIDNMKDYPNHDFLGWDNSTTGITHDTRITAVFDEVQMCTVKFINSADGSLILTTMVPLGSTIPVSAYPTPPNVEHMTFKNWNGNTSGIYGNVNIYAIYEYVNVQVQFVDYNGNILSTQTVKYNDTGSTPSGIVVPDLKVRIDPVNEPEILSTIRFNGRYCYVRDEFDTETGCSRPEEMVITQDVTKFMAQYDVIATETTTCNVRFYNYDSTYWFTDTVYYGTVIDRTYTQSVLDVFISEGETPDLSTQTFYAWADGQGNEYIVGQNDLVVKEDISLYARYKMISYTIQFYVQRNPVYYPNIIDMPIESLTTEVLKNTPIDRPDCSNVPERIHFETFCDGLNNRWYSDTACTIEWEFKQDVQMHPVENPDLVNSDMILYGKYIGKEYNLIYNIDNGTPAQRETYRYPTPTVRPTNPTKQGYTFIGWYFFDGTTDVEFEFGNPLTGNTLIYAKWFDVPEESTILYNAGADLSVYMADMGSAHLIQEQCTWDRTTGDGALVYDSPIEEFNIGVSNNYSSVTVNTEIKRNLHTITIPKDTTNVVSGQFEDCRYLYAIYTSEENEKYYSVDGVLYSLESGYPFTLIESYPQAKTDESFTLEDIPIIISQLCFANCKNLKSVDLGSEIIGLRDRSFINCINLKEVKCSNISYPVSPTNSFSGVDVAHCKLFIPCQSYDSYSDSPVWGQFDIQCTGDTGSYITFTALENNSELGLASRSSSQTVLEYSTGGTVWSDFTTGVSIELNSGETVFVRGKLATGVTPSDLTQFKMPSGKFSVSGDIKSIWSYQDLEQPLFDFCGVYLFRYCAGLVDASGLILETSATTLANYCYSSMFQGCSSLTTIPELPATTLATSCYSDMFYSCTSLTGVPSDLLPATSLTMFCYSNMFSGCTSLANAPELPATALTNYCYYKMFAGCSSLTTAPELPATALTSYCYYEMFRNCSNLNYIKCLAISGINESNSTQSWVSNVANSGMFIEHPDAVGLWPVNDINGIPIGWRGAENYITFTAMQNNSTIGLKKRSYHQEIFEYCTGGTEWSDFNTGDTITLANVGDTVYIRGKLTGNNDHISNYTQFEITGGTFSVSGNINSLWEYGDLDRPLYNYCGCSLFRDCEGLVDASGLTLGSSATTLSYGCYDGMFAYCTRLVTTPELPSTNLSGDCYIIMFIGCTSLTGVPSDLLPATILSNRCYQQMFEGCTSLTEAPELPATALTDDCYLEMFRGCSNLNYIKCLAVDGIDQSGSTTQWVRGVASTGTFVEHEDAVGLWPINSDNGIPIGWRIDRYITFTAQEANSTIWINNIGSNAPNIEYSTGGTTWETWDYSTITLSNIGDKVRMRGTNTSGFSNYSHSYSNFVMTGKISASGSVMSLIDYTQELNVIPNENCFYRLFASCGSLTNTPELPATVLTIGCYYFMFSGCTSLSGIPSNLLPATALTKQCYQDMFRGCTSLSDVPSDLLPATALTYQCYSGMFAGCTGLTSIPSNLLPATTLAEYCYRGMFSSCTSLSGIPSNLLPATALTSNSVLTSNYGCYSGMFAGCTGLISIPNNFLPATELARACYRGMFNGCTSLSGVPSSLLPATALTFGCYYEMFSGCTSLSGVPSDLLPATALADSCYESMFVGCTSLTETPYLPATNLSGASYCYCQMFDGCAGLTTVHVLPATALANGCYEGMFRSCTSLSGVPSNLLPATDLAESCYGLMFQGCTSLTTAPDLPAPNLRWYCYNYMFSGCTSLSYIKCLAYNKGNNTTNWVDGVASSGTFIKHSIADWGTPSVNTTPPGWNVIDA